MKVKIIFDIDCNNAEYIQSLAEYLEDEIGGDLGYWIKNFKLEAFK